MDGHTGFGRHRRHQDAREGGEPSRQERPGLRRRLRELDVRRLFALHADGELAFFGQSHGLCDWREFVRHIASLRRNKWMVFAKPPFAGPEAVLAYLTRYTHRVAISNRRLISISAAGVSFRYKDYCRSDAERYQMMTLNPAHFIRRFLLHVLPPACHRIRHCGLFASATRKANIARARGLLAVPYPITSEVSDDEAAAEPWRQCPCCVGRMLPRSGQPRAPPATSGASGRTWS